MSKKHLLGLTMIALAITLLFASLKAGSSTATSEVRGIVWDSSGNPLVDVRVRAYRNGQLLTQKFTNNSPKAGLYLVDVDGDEPFSLIYDRSDLQSFVLPDVSGTNTINKVMFRKGEGNAQIQLAGQFADQYLKSIQSIEPPPRQ